MIFKLKVWATRRFSPMDIRRGVVSETWSVPGTGLRDWRETLTENGRQALRLWQVEQREIPAGWSWQGRRVEAASSGWMLFLWHFVQVVLLSVLRFHSSIQVRICLPITDDVICHIFVYSLLVYARRILTYSKHGGVFVYICMCSLSTWDVTQCGGGRWFAYQLGNIVGDQDSVWKRDREASWGLWPLCFL